MKKNVTLTKKEKNNFNEDTCFYYIMLTKLSEGWPQTVAGLMC